MPYKPILFKRDKDGSQYAIVNTDNSAFAPNLSDNEIAIDVLSAGDCPINLSCIYYTSEDKVSIICEHFTSLLQLADNKFSHEGLYCNKNKKYCEVAVLKPVNCPDDRDSCLECEKLLNIITDPYPEKSNCHTVCG